jgi:hypothetical protein
MFASRNIQLHAELLKQAEEKLALDPQALRMLLAGGAGALAAGVPAALITRHVDGDVKQRATNRDLVPASPRASPHHGSSGACFTSHAEASSRWRSSREPRQRPVVGGRLGSDPGGG